MKTRRLIVAGSWREAHIILVCNACERSGAGNCPCPMPHVHEPQKDGERCEQCFAVVDAVKQAEALPRLRCAAKPSEPGSDLRHRPARVITPM